MPTPLENNTEALKQLKVKANALPDKSDGSTSTKITIKEMYCNPIIKGVDEYEGQEKRPELYWSFYMYINGTRFINSEYGEGAIRVDDRPGELISINIDPFEIDPSKDFISFFPQTEAAFATYTIDGNKLIVQSYFW